MYIKYNIIMVIIGTFIGAGLMSGKEINLFFVKYGIEGLWGCELTICIIILFIYLIIDVSKHNRIKSNEELNNEIIKNNKIKNYINKITEIFLLCSYYIMETGLCTFLNEINKIPIIITSIANFLLIYLLIKNQIKGLLKINSIFVPLIILFIVSIICNQIKYIDFQNFNYKIHFMKMLICGVNSFLYVGYNLLILIPIVLNFSNIVKNDKILKHILIFIFLILNIILIGIYIILYQNNIDTEEEFPILKILNNDLYGKKIFPIILILSIITSELSAVYGYIQRDISSNCFKEKLLNKLLIGILIAYMGFGNLIKIFYHIFGLLGIIEMFLILRYYSIAKINKN